MHLKIIKKPNHDHTYKVDKPLVFSPQLKSAVHHQV